MLKAFKSKIKVQPSSQGKEDPMAGDSSHAETEKYRRLEDRVDADESVVSAKSTFKGEISGQAGAHILGSFEGDIRSDGLVRAGRTAKIKGNIHSPYVILEGELQGNIVSARQVELRNRAKMRGNIETEMLAIADGCFFEGQIRMATPEAQPVRFTERRHPEDE
jgi:cytoskeletal protein CcmA (bactofilin family)